MGARKPESKVLISDCIVQDFVAQGRGEGAGEAAVGLWVQHGDEGQDLRLPPGTSALGLERRHNASPHYRMAIGSRSHTWHEFGSSQPGVPPAEDHKAEGTPLWSSAAASLGVHVGAHPAPHRTACYSPQVCRQLMELVPGELPRSLGEWRVNEAPATAAGTSTRGTATGTGSGWMDGWTDGSAGPDAGDAGAREDAGRCGDAQLCGDAGACRDTRVQRCSGVQGFLHTPHSLTAVPRGRCFQQRSSTATYRAGPGGHRAGGGPESAPLGGSP
ncbi:uncharacterized protein LOC109363702 [Meleagris gallopavo]|uniref:uncharacterized protein LOC109363702 n=1 Tax=Meleagris gallopavo TaxID=9103 RepID=UPI00093E6EA8|nr:uncharacterized protein LOC109363702 [Meleagris gallopavo]